MCVRTSADLQLRDRYERRGDRLCTLQGHGPLLGGAQPLLVLGLGKQEPIEEILSIADVFIMPSGSETFGLAALDAMACGVPVVATDIGGLPELIEDGDTGFLCPVNDIPCFVDRVRRLVEDSDLQATMGRSARESASDRFDVNRIVPMYESYYERVKAGDVLHVG